MSELAEERLEGLLRKSSEAHAEEDKVLPRLDVGPSWCARFISRQPRGGNE